MATVAPIKVELPASATVTPESTTTAPPLVGYATPGPELVMTTGMSPVPDAAGGSRLANSGKVKLLPNPLKVKSGPSGSGEKYSPWLAVGLAGFAAKKNHSGNEV